MNMRAETIKYYSSSRLPLLLDDDGAVIREVPTGNAAGAEFLGMVRKLECEHGLPWSRAFEIVKNSYEGQSALRRYGQARAEATVDRPDLEIDRLAEEHMRQSGEPDYSTACRYVLASNPHLAKRYLARSRR
jgi:hypothetical protein